MPHPVLADLDELAALLRPSWAEMSKGLAASGVPVCEDKDDDAKDDDKAKDDDDDADKDTDADKADVTDDADDPADDDDDASESDKKDWRAELRKYERSSKRASDKDKKTIADLQNKLQKAEDADKTEQQKAIDDAKAEGRTEALTEVQKEQRSNRLEVAVTRAAAKGIKVDVEEDGKTVEKTVRFADPDDALVYLERGIAKGDFDADDIFDDDGKVQKDALTEALAEIIDDKPHLVGKSKAESDKDEVKGKADQGKGKGGGSKSLEDMSPDDHLKQLQGAK